MQADISRDTFDRQHLFARVLMQQGRVLLDADWNEQVAILLHGTRALAADLIGAHGGPGDSFLIAPGPDAFDFTILPGHYYVDGILCENLVPVRCPASTDLPLVTYLSQPHFPIHVNRDDPARLTGDGAFLVYLDVWERHLSHLQVGHIRELALGGPDTATRSRVVWQVKCIAEDDEPAGPNPCAELIERLVAEPQRRPRCLRARARVEAPSDDPCIVAPEAQYRGAENQLYRVEIHDAGTAAAPAPATFKWSRENGSVVFGIRGVKGSIVTLASLGPDEHCGLKEGHRVEIVDDFSELRANPRRLLKVAAVDRVACSVTLDAPDGIDPPAIGAEGTGHPLLRRWDQPSDVIPIEESEWINLEDGVQIFFVSGGTYQVGDYWQIPARAAIADVLWLQEPGPGGQPAPKAMPPAGIVHHYAPLGRITVLASEVNLDSDCRHSFMSLADLTEAQRAAADDGSAPPASPGAVPVDSLEAIDGVGPTFARRLRAAGIDNAAAVAALDLGRLIELLSPPDGPPLSAARAEMILADARAKAAPA